MAVFSIGQVWGDPTTYTFTDVSTPTTATADGLTFTFDKGSGSTNPAWNSGSSEARLYAKGTLTITSSSKTITSVVFNYNINANKSGTKPTISSVAGSENAGTWNATDKTWSDATGDKTITFTTTGSAGNIGFKSITITFAAATACADPVFDPNGGSVTSGTEVTITTETEGATIYYTMGADPADPTSSDNEYTDPIEITANTTIKAIAIKEGLTNSSVVSKSFTVAAPLTDEEFAWSASEYAATLNAVNTYPTFTNTHSLEVTYQSTDENVATIDAEGTITLKKAGTTTIKAIFAGNSTYVAKTVEYTLTASKGAGWIDYDFSQIEGFNSWGNSYTSHTAEYTEADVVFESASKQTSTISDIPVTKGAGDVVLKLKGTYASREMEAVEFICRQWGTKSQTITLKYSTDGGDNYSDLEPSVSSSNFIISSNSLPAGTNAVKITFSSTNDHIGIASVSFKLRTLVNSEVTITNPAHGTITVMNGETPVNDGTSIQSGTVLTVSGASNNAAYRFGTIRAYKTDDAETTVTITEGALTMPAYPITITADETALYAVAVAVNDNTMGSATINGGTATVYVDDDDEITLVATANPGYEFVEWTVSDENIALDVATNASTTALAAAAGTITANFQAQACTGLAAPTLDEVTKTYNSATIAWVAVDNAEGYVLNIKKHEGNVAVVTDEVIVAPTVSFEKTGLEANTQYDYSVMAVGDGTAYCDESNPLLEGNFTTSDYPSVAVTYSENGNSVSGGTKQIMNAFALPTEVTNNISGKTFVGWTTKADFTDGDEAEDTYYAAGADFTIESNAAVTLYAVYATAAGGAGETWVINTTNFDKAGSGSGYALYNGDHTLSGITYNSSNVMIQSNKIQFKSGQGVIYSKTEFSADIVSIAIDGIDANITVYEGAEEISTGGTAVTLNNGVYPFSAGNRFFRIKMGSATGQANSITVNLAGEVSYSDYVISGSAALPVLDAPTGLTAGTYYEEQTITLAATNGADIYYTTDGTAPSTSSTKYTAPFTLSEYGTYNVKAIAAKDGFETSEVAEATYAIGKVFASVSDLYTYLEAQSLTEMANVKVTGLVSRITTAWDGSKLTYYISDNGQATNDLQMYRGVGTGADELAVGDQVTVTGNYTLFQGTTHEFAAGNTIVARTAAAVASVAIGGTAEKTTYSPEDNVFSRAGLTATATYNTGYEKDVTSDATWTNNLTNDIVTETGKVTVTATYGDKNDTKEVDVIYSSKTLDHITLSYTSTTAYIGMALPTPTVTASYVEEIAAEDVTELVAAANGFDTESAYNGSAAGTYTINVSYTLGAVSKTAEYTVTVKSVYNSENEPYSVAQALEIIGALFNTTTASADSIVVAGKVSRLDGTYVNTYWISDDGTTNNELEVYSGKYLNKANFTAQNQLHVGDEVVVKGKVKTYNSTKEFDSNSRLVSLAREAEVTVANVAELEVGQADLAVEDLTITTLSEGEVTLVSGDAEIATIVNNKIHAVAAGDVTITANVAAAGIYKAASAEFTVTVVAAKTRYAVTFDADGGEGTDPVIADQLEGATVELPENPYSKENSAFAGWVVNDGAVEITDGHFTMPAAAVTIKATWNVVATCAISFKVNDAVVATADAPQTAEYSLASVEHPTVPGFTWVGWSEDEVAGEVDEMPTIITSYTPEAGESSLTLYGIYSRVDDSDPNYGKYVKATAVAEGDYLIVCEIENLAFDGSLETLDASGNTQAVAITDGALTLEDAEDYVFTIAEVTDGYSIKAASGKYIGHGSDANGLTASASALVNTISITDGNADIVGAGGAYLRYNATSGQDRFRYFKSSTYSSQKAIQLYKKNVGSTVYTSSPIEKVTVTFALDGGEGGCQTTKINKGGKLTICEDVPTKAHYDFDGWKNGDDVYTAGEEYTFDASVTITAQWKAIPTYTVTYEKGGEDVTGSIAQVQNIERGTTIQLSDGTGFTYTGHMFTGWKQNGEGDLLEAGSDYTVNGNVTFVAQWTPIYTVTYQAGEGATGADVVRTNVPAGDYTLEDKPEGFSKDLDAFRGWKLNGEGGLLAAGSTYTLNANAIFVAVWEAPTTCVLTLSRNGVTEVLAEPIAQAQEFDLSDYTADNTAGYTFAGWTDEPIEGDVTDVVPFTSYTPAVGVTEKTLYAVYSRTDESVGSGKYEKATEIASGAYLIVCGNQNVALDGSLTNMDASGNTKAVSITDGVLTLENAENYVFTIAAKDGGYSIKSASGKYIGHTGSSNALKTSDTDAYTNTISISDGNATVTCNNSYKLQYNSQSGQERFRYFSGTQTAIQLYKEKMGQTVYATSPVEKITITFNANEGEGGCQNATINKGSQLTICAEIPTKDKTVVFAGWKNGDDVYEAGNTYTFNESMTLTAQWDPAQTYTVTYSIEGADGGQEAPTQAAQYAGDQFTIANGVTKSGYIFKGWKYNGKLYKEGKTFTMPAANVTFKANWKKNNIPTEKMSLITDDGMLSSGMEVILACKAEGKAAGAFSSENTYMSSVTATFSGNDITVANAIIFVLEKANGGWLLKNNDKYLARVNGGNYAGLSAQAFVWNISIGENAIIQHGDSMLMYNNGTYSRFSLYKNTSGQQKIQLYGKTTVLPAPQGEEEEVQVNASDLGYVEDQVIVVPSGTTLTIDEPEAPSFIAQAGSTVKVTGDGTNDEDKPVQGKSMIAEIGGKIEVTAPTVVNNIFYVQSRRGQGSGTNPTVAGKITGANNVRVESPGHFDFTLAVTGEAAAAQWHDFSVPFPVNALTGVYGYRNGNWEKLTNEEDYAILDFHGDFRANGQYSWKKFRGELTPGKIYSLTVNGDVETFRFMKTEAPYTLESQKARYEFHSGAGDESRHGWNGLGNSRLSDVSVDVSEIGGSNIKVCVLVYDENYPSGGYVAVPANQITLMIGSAFLIQTNADNQDVAFGTANSGENVIYYAPRRAAANEISEVKVTFTDGRYIDNLFLSASEDATNSYEIGKDLVKMFVTNTPAVPTLYTTNYNGTKLASENAPLNGESVDYALTLFAPKAGEYTVAATQIEGATVYLTRNGQIIWNLSNGAYTTEMTQGADASYGIRIVKAPNALTGTENIEASEAGAQKVIIDNNVYILRNEKMYDVTGKEVK